MASFQRKLGAREVAKGCRAAEQAAHSTVVDVQQQADAPHLQQAQVLHQR